MSNIILTFASIFFLACFVFQIKEQFSKYFNKETTTVVKFQRNSALSFPAISFCPGFKRDFVIDQGWQLIQWNPVDGDEKQMMREMFPKSKRELEEYWKNATFEFDEIVQKFGAQTEVGNYNSFFLHKKDLKDHMDKYNLELKVTNGISGKCFTILSKVRNYKS